MYVSNPDLEAAAANGVRTALNGGSLFFFAGTVPSNPDDALDMVATHTQVAEISVDGAGGGLNFDSSTDGFLYKSASEVWKGLVAFDGKDDGLTTLTPSFFRFCATGDDGRGVGTGPRLQGTITGQDGNGDVKLVSPTVTANGTNEVGLAGYYVELTSLAG